VLVEIGDALDRLEGPFVDTLEAVQTQDDLFEPALHEVDLVGDPLRPFPLLDLHPVQAGRKCLDRLHHRDDLRVLFFRHAPGHEDPEVADVLVQEADDDLAARLDVLGRAIDIGHPVEGLLRGRDVIAERGEEDDG